MGLGLVRSLLFAPATTGPAITTWSVLHARIFVPAILQAIAVPGAPVEWVQDCMLCVAQLVNAYPDRKWGGEAGEVLGFSEWCCTLTHSMALLPPRHSQGCKCSFASSSRCTRR